MRYLSFFLPLSLSLSLSQHLSLENDERNTNHSDVVIVQRNNSLIFWKNDFLKCYLAELMKYEQLEQISLSDPIHRNMNAFELCKSN